jgi:hypothetical protein
VRYQFASGRSQLPFESSWLTSEAGNVATPRSLYFALVGENPAGVNQLSAVVGPVAIAANTAQRLTLPTSLPLAGESWQSYILAASTTNTPSSFVQIAKIAAVDATGNTLPLPLSIVLSSDAHFTLSGIVANPAALPANPVAGMLRAVTSLAGKVFEYDPDSTLVDNGESVLPAVDGAWVWKPGNFSAYVAATT